jgi:hypothetical protein
VREDAALAGNGRRGDQSTLAAPPEVAANVVKKGWGGPLGPSLRRIGVSQKFAHPSNKIAHPRHSQSASVVETLPAPSSVTPAPDWRSERGWTASRVRASARSSLTMAEEAWACAQMLLLITRRNRSRSRACA